MNINPELLNYIENNIKQGFTKEQITNALLANGWKKEIIDEALKQLENKNKNNKNATTSTTNISTNVTIQQPLQNTTTIQNKQETSKKETNENNFRKHSLIVFIAIIFLAVAAVSGVFLISKNLKEKTENIAIENNNELLTKNENNNINNQNNNDNYNNYENVNFEQKPTLSNKENIEKYEYNYMDDEILRKIIEEENENTKPSQEFKEALLLNNTP